jgi:hypothetical protein
MQLMRANSHGEEGLETLNPEQRARPPRLPSYDTWLSLSSSYEGFYRVFSHFGFRWGN